MTDQAQRLEIATVRAEIGSNITYRFNNDAIDAGGIPTESGDIPNLKQVILQLQEDGAEKISFATTIYPTTAAGIAATTDGAVFLVVSNQADEIYAVYTNTAGVAVDTGKRALSSQAVQDAMQAATEAAEAAQDAADLSTQRTARFLAPISTPPVIRDDGTTLQIGDRYVNTVDQAEYIYKTEGWALNDSLVAVEAIADAADPAKGAALVGFDDETVDSVLLNAKTMASYSALRNYSGRATAVRVTGFGVAGRFYLDAADTASSDNGGTVLVGAGGRRWKRAFSCPVSPMWFGAAGDGATDDAVALHAWANCGHKNLEWPEGKFRVTAASQIALSATEYAYSDTGLFACFKFPAGVSVMTAGTATQLIVDNPSATTCGFAISEDVSGTPSSHSQALTHIGKITLRANGSSGKFGVITPASATLLSNKRPRYNLDVHFAPEPGRDDKTISTYGWAVGIMMGDTVDARVNFSGYGTYNANADDAGQHQMTGFKVGSPAGSAFGITLRFQAQNMRNFADFGDGVEGFSASDFEGLGCWEGIISSNTAPEPGGFVGDGHINANKAPYRFMNRLSLQIGSLEAYRSDNFFMHGGSWSGIASNACGRLTVQSLNVIHGSLQAKTDAVALRAENGTTFILNSYQATSLHAVVKVTDSPDCIVGDGITNAVDVVNDLYGALTADFTGGKVSNRAGTTTYFATDGLVDKKRLRFPDTTSLALRTQQTVTVSAAGTLTLKPREAPNNLSVILAAGTAAFTYDILLDAASAVPGDVIKIKIIGNSSANPTVRVMQGATVLSTFNNIGGTKRLACEYVAVEAGVSANWSESFILDSLELQY